MEYLNFKKCIVCGDSRLKPLGNGYDRNYLVQCANCAMVFSARIPTLEELNNHYTNAYAREEFISPITIKRYNELLDSFEIYRKSNKIIDVGCGNGFFLEAAKKRGWEVYGTEYTPTAFEICEKKGINMQLGPLDINNYTEGMFDVVTSFEVIEHINTPNTEIDAFKHILRSGGALYITTPNFSSITRSITKSNWNVIFYPEHLSYYTAGTLNYLLKKHGFKRIYKQTTGIAFDRIQNSLRKKKGNTGMIASHQGVGVNDNMLREKTETKFIYKAAKKIINTTLNMTSKGDALKALYVKA